MEVDSVTSLLTKDEPSPSKSRASTTKNPLKRLGSKIKKELDDIWAFRAMSLEEIRKANQEKFMEHVKKQDEREQVMARRYGVVGKAVAKRTRTTLSHPPCCSLGTVSPDIDRYNCIS